MAKNSHDPDTCNDVACPKCYELFRSEINAEERYWQFIEVCARAAVLLGVVAALYVYYRFHH